MGLVSVVIPTFDSERTLERCLASVFGQSHSEIECIVVDNLSADRTTDIVKRYPAKLIKRRGGRTAAKNAGLEKAEGEFVLFIDSDMELGPGVVKECLDVMSDKDGGLIIPERSIGGSFWVKVRDFERSFYAGTVIESARFFRTSLVRQTGGFDESVIFFEESVVPERIRELGYKVDKRIKASIDHIEEGFSLKVWLGKKFKYGKTAGKGKRTSVIHRLGLLLGRRRFYSRPILAIGVLVLKFLEFLAILAGRVSG